MSHFVDSELGLHCLHDTPKQVSGLKMVEYIFYYQVGLDGCGKSTVAHLSSFIAGCELFKLTLHRGYSTSEFREDLKKVFLQAGVKNEKIIFLLTDSDIVKVSQLLYVFCGGGWFWMIVMVGYILLKFEVTSEQKIKAILQADRTDSAS